MPNTLEFNDEGKPRLRRFSRVDFDLHPGIDEWVATLSERKQRVVNARLDGQSFKQCGKKVGITADAARQMLKMLARQAPVMREDKYRFLFERYDISLSQFSAVTGLSQRVCRFFLLSKDVRGDRDPLKLALKDARLPSQVRLNLKHLLDEDYIEVEGQYVHKDKHAILAWIVRTHASDKLICWEELYELYNSFLSEHGLSQAKGLVAGGQRALRAVVGRNKHILDAPRPRSVMPQGQCIRSYNCAQMDFSHLRDCLSSGRFGDIECSARLVYDDPLVSKIARKLDIRDEYELHTIIARFCCDIEGLELERTPMLKFGKGNRYDQILALIIQIGPADSATLAKAYSKRYGVREATFMNSFLKGFAAYRSKYHYVASMQALGAKLAELASEELGGDYVAVSPVRARLKDALPRTAALLKDDHALAPSGYHADGALYIRSDVDEGALFEKIICLKQRFRVDDIQLGAELFSCPGFIAVLNKKLRNLDYIEYEKGAYISNKVFSELDPPATAWDFRSFIDDILAFMEPDIPYTMHRLRALGFEHRLFDLEAKARMGEYFFNSILAHAYAGAKAKHCTIAKCLVFCKTSLPFSVQSVFEYIISWQENPSVEAMVSCLADEFGIKVSPQYVRAVLKRYDVPRHS